MFVDLIFIEPSTKPCAISAAISTDTWTTNIKEMHVFVQHDKRMLVARVNIIVFQNAFFFEISAHKAHWKWVSNNAISRWICLFTENWLWLYYLFTQRVGTRPLLLNNLELTQEGFRLYFLDWFVLRKCLKQNASYGRAPHTKIVFCKNGQRILFEWIKPIHLFMDLVTL